MLSSLRASGLRLPVFLESGGPFGAASASIRRTIKPGALHRSMDIPTGNLHGVHQPGTGSAWGAPRTDHLLRTIILWRKRWFDKTVLLDFELLYFPVQQRLRGRHCDLLVILLAS